MDQAAIYGGFMAEEIFGGALRAAPALKDRIEIVTKCDIIAPVGRHETARVKHYDTGRAHITQSVEASLRLMGIETIDLLLIHSDGNDEAVLAGTDAAETVVDLRDAGLVHKIESLNAFIGCAKPDRRHSAQFLICIDCGAVAEMDDPNLSAAIGANARRLGFAVEQETVEVEGRCAACRG